MCPKTVVPLDGRAVSSSCVQQAENNKEEQSDSQNFAAIERGSDLRGMLMKVPSPEE